MRKNIKSQEYKKILYNIFIILLICAAYYIFDINCMIRRLTGIPCPGCGMSRAVYNIFKGNVAEAFRFHPLFPLIPFILLAMTNILNKHIKIKNTILIITAVLFFSAYIVRMYLYFPDIAPMELNENAVLFRLINFLR